MLSTLTNEQTPTPYRPRSFREFAEAILACTIPPEEYEKLYRQATETVRKQAEAVIDQPAERERLLRLGDSKVDRLDAGKWICRVVYIYPQAEGTMTTYLRMTRADSDRLRELLEGCALRGGHTPRHHDHLYVGLPRTP